MESTERLKPGDLVIHFKHELNPQKDRLEYVKRYLGPAIDSETGEEVAIYKEITGARRTWVRPLAMFFSEVDFAKYPTVRQKYRFEKFTL